MDPNKGNKESRKIVSILGAALAIGLVLANINAIYGLLTSVFTISNTGVVKSANFNVYWESQCINIVSSINWGSLEPGASKSVTVYVKNTGNVALTLSLSTQNWSPPNAETYLNISWNYTGAQIQPNKVIPVTLTLKVSQSIQGITNFSFNIVITGTEVT